MVFKKRRPLRLAKYDYSSPAAYFVTLCTYKHAVLFGKIIDDRVCLNYAGKFIENWWIEISHKYDNICLDKFVVMPNHFHGILIIENVGADLRVRPADLPSAIRWFKTMTTNQYIKNVKDGKLEFFDKYLWQRNYFEHIIRNETDLQRRREYIANNPVKWSFDEYHQKTDGGG